MTIDNIIKKINEESSAEINKILEEARNESKEMEAEANKSISSELASIQNEGKKRITIMRNIHLSEARRTARRTALSAKEDLIEECFSQAKERLKSMTGEEYKQVLVQIINESLPLINNKGNVILSREEDRAILSSFPNLSIKSGTTSALGGLIFESIDGKVVVDNTFDAILERQKEDIRTEIAKILFPDS
jgi:V/A-type H+-transporting ATPase subunit E